MQYLTALVAFTAAALISSAAAQCTGQGPGNCNIIYSCSSEIASANIDCGMTLYDYTCAVIGGTWISPNQGEVLTSQLPYTIILDYLLGIYDSGIEFNFRYAAGSYGTGISNCSKGGCSMGLTACEYAIYMLLPLLGMPLCRRILGGRLGSRGEMKVLR